MKQRRCGYFNDADDMTCPLPFTAHRLPLCKMYPYQQHASINALPIELLSYIFTLATHSFPDTEVVPFDAESVRTPVILSAVNHHWRTVAHSTSALWTSVCVTIGSIERTKNSFDTSHLSSFISLSRNRPFDILIDARDLDWDFSEPE